MTARNDKTPRIGYSLDSVFDGFELVFLRAEFEAVIDALRPYFAPPAGKPPCGFDTVMFEFDDSAWTGLLYDFRCVASRADLSKTLQTSCVALINEKLSNWTLFEVISNGTVIEEYEFGQVYEEDIGAPRLGWHAVTAEEDGYEYRFRSEVRTVEESELKPDERFLDQSFRSHGIWCPDWDTICEMPNIAGAKSARIMIYW